MSEYKDEEQLFKELRAALISYYRSNNMDLVPHMVMSHGFIQWYNLLAATGFRSLTWRGEEVEDKDGELFQIYMHSLFKRFWIALMEGVDLPPEEKRHLLIVGWRAYLRD